MKHLFYALAAFMTVFIAECAHSQSQDTIKQSVRPTVLRDSLLMNLNSNVETVSQWANDQQIRAGVGRYKVYPTTNVYTSLKLDTATGKVTALQISLGETDALEYPISDAVLSYYESCYVGRFELYPTQNKLNFILLDTILGFAYQVQWSTEDEKCGRWRIW